jgi:hypothetical protein
MLVKSHVSGPFLNADRWLIRGIAGPLRLSSNPRPGAGSAAHSGIAAKSKLGEAQTWTTDRGALKNSHLADLR